MSTITPSKSRVGTEHQSPEAASPTSPGSPSETEGDYLWRTDVVFPAVLSGAESASPPLSLASIIGDAFDGADGDDFELTDVGTGETVAVEGMGVNAADLQALLDGV